jgi:hypothetical protein
VIQVERVQVKWHAGVVVMIHGGVWLIQGVLLELCVVFRVVGNDGAADRSNMRGEIGGAFPGLRFVNMDRKACKKQS